ncbi:glycosyltransferase family 2 protein [Pseudomonas guariconensis]|uniref:glycosyltransferase family 2 protein n=1 Tax=Pseudomonas guariconensis TaxID=1288410 RepID=UPI0018DA0921|nr:glycosyltransferase family 2 protein [Pseudomonas guariconensis]MBH3359960.1 glycosyltransferase [Pseudomonas guariconensis]MDM9595253.1 glycosyltransferase family 2 protein [Pseudomonas guariconensis]MDM9608082.1 glycosyltransferase family 2 protein [Pseudomonas guariconensis]MDM9613039.1 glycosyltransferase family 2 protein [Pseudomonas guariconensis]
MKISIVTVAYNSAATIRDTIESVLRQSHPAIEYIIVDGASKDQTMTIVAEYQDRIATVISEPDKGLYDAMNKGIAMATGDVIGILNSDDFFETDDALATVARAFEQNPHVQLAFGDIVFVDSHDLANVTRFYGAAHFRPWKLRFGWMPPHPGTYVRREAYDQVGEYSTEYRISADYDMFIRLLLVKKMPWTHIDQVLVRMRAGGLSTAGMRSSIRLNAEIVQACRRNGVYTNMALVLSKLPFKLLEYIRRPRSSH